MQSHRTISSRLKMGMPCLALGAALISLAVQAAPSHDTLTPGSEVVRSGMEEKLRQMAFQDAYAPGVQVRALFEASLGGREAIMGIRRVGSRYVVFCATAPGRLALDTPPARVAPARFMHRPLAAAIARRASAVWRRMLQMARIDPDTRFGADGAGIEFSMPSGTRTLRGRAWSPRTPKLTALVNVAEDLDDVCRGRIPESRVAGDLAKFEKLLDARR